MVKYFHLIVAYYFHLLIQNTYLLFIFIYLFRFFNQHQPNGKIITKSQLNSTSITNYNFAIRN